MHSTIQHYRTIPSLSRLLFYVRLLALFLFIFLWSKFYLILSFLRFIIHIRLYFFLHFRPLLPLTGKLFLISSIMTTRTFLLVLFLQQCVFCLHLVLLTFYAFPIFFLHLHLCSSTSHCLVFYEYLDLTLSSFFSSSITSVHFSFLPHIYIFCLNLLSLFLLNSSTSVSITLKSPPFFIILLVLFHCCFTAG